MPTMGQFLDPKLKVRRVGRYCIFGRLKCGHRGLTVPKNYFKGMHGERYDNSNS